MTTSGDLALAVDCAADFELLERAPANAERADVDQ
jgi:hypothetical protein